jgi:hypothetical protein
MVLILAFFESINVRSLKLTGIPKLKVSKFYVAVLSLYVLVKIFIGLNVGFRIFDYGIDATGDKYVVPGWSGISAILQWLLIIFIPYVRKKYVVLAVLAIVIISGVLHVKRGDIVRVFSFLLIFYSYRVLSSGSLNWKSIFYVALFLIFTALSFTIFGQLRLAARGSGDDAIIEFLGSRIDSVAFSWLYGYLTFGFEVLSLYYDEPPSYDYFWILKKILGFEMIDKEASYSISAFNAPTFLAEHVKAFGNYYFLSIMFFSLLSVSLILIVKKMRFLGAYIFIGSLFMLMVFGDYLLNRSIFFSLIVSILVFPFLTLSKEGSNKFPSKF